ncbi:MAG: phage portal protein [Oscillospiraceae bacterium]|nr:phage portal protein [Oscillospiraceae bacterium]
MHTPFRRLEYYIMGEDEILDTDMLAFWLKEHKMDCVRFQHLRELYENRHPILKEPRKPDWKPDNRILANIPKYIVDTFNGAFIGIPVKTECPDKHFLAKILEIHKANDLDDSFAELSKISSIYGNAFELCYLDENANVRITYFTPLEAFIIYDDSVERRPLYGIRYYFDRNHVMHGTVYTRSEILEFTDEGSLHFTDESRPHFFDGVPIVEYIENDERFGAFEHEESLINAYEKALSEKANDVDAFADNYLLLKGVDLDPENLRTIRQDRVIQVPPMDETMLSAVDVEFLTKTTGDTTQENLLDRLETLIFSMAMVANISDEEFGGSSGTALAYKLQPMRNRAKEKERKFASGMNQRWRLVASVIATTESEKQLWKDLTYRFTFNVPKNLLEEAQTASQMSGITSRRTQLSVISAVNDVEQEMQDIDQENSSSASDQYLNFRTGVEDG